MERHQFTVLVFQHIHSFLAISKLMVLSKYPIKYLELVSVSINFETSILSTLADQFFFVLFSPSIFSFATFVSPNFNINYTIKKCIAIIF